MPRGGRKKEAAAGGGAPGWMVTYGDLMSLLLTFFVLLLSFSAVRMEDFQEALESIRREFVLLDFPSREPEILPPIVQTFPAGAARLRGAAQRIRTAAEQLNLELQVQVVEESEGVRITIEAPVLFDSGSDVLRAPGRELLRVVLNEIISMPNAIIIEGHTDNVPISTVRFPSNWELSTGRAIAVAQFFMRDGGMEPGRIGVAGYSEYRPLASNDTAEGRQKNRRVEIFIAKE